MTLHIQATEAASHWQGHILRLIRDRENAVFEMEGPQGRAALRLHRPGYQTEDSIRSELWCCEALAAAGVSVPRPLPTTDGAPVARLAGGRLASAVAWVAGMPLGETGVHLAEPMSLQLDRHRVLGRLLAQMHTAAEGLALPEGFTRPRWDLPGLVGEAPFWGRFWDHPAATDDQRRMLVRVRDFLREWLPQTPCAFGLIHADVLRENVLVNDHSLTLIDFDDCGFGFFLYDLGTAMLGNLIEPAYPALLSALVSGYAETRSATKESVEVFTLARACASVGWTIPRLSLEDPVNKSHIARCTTLAARLIR